MLTAILKLLTRQRPPYLPLDSLPLHQNFCSIQLKCPVIVLSTADSLVQKL